MLPPSRQLAAASALAVAMAAVGCGSSATTATATSPSAVSRCAVTVSGDGQVPAQGGTRSFGVSAARECAWSARVEGQWLTIKNGASGQGDGAVEIAAAANPDPQVRRGSIVLNEQRVEVQQAAGECSYTLSESAGTFGQSGGSGAFEVRASSSLCTWTAASDSGWIVVRSGVSGKGTMPVQFDVAATTGAPRTGTITAAGLRFSVTQSACAYGAAPLAHTVSTAGGVVSVAVTTGPNCPWTASSPDPWIAVAGPASFTGPGNATFNVAAVSGPARKGTAVVAGQTVTISQGDACSFSIAPEFASIPSGGGDGRVTVTTGAGCAWTATSNAPWLQITDGASRTGSGDVVYQAAATTGSRSGTLTIAGRTFTVSQSGPCTYAISPESRSVDDKANDFTVAVTAAPGCAWEFSSQVSWLTLRLQGSQSGNGTVQVTVSENNGAARSGTATIAGRTLTVNQAAAPCAYNVSPLEKKVSSDSGTTKVDVDTSAGCTWSATSNVGWIRIDSGATGSGKGQVSLSYASNPGAERVGTVTIAGQVFTLTQRK